MLTIEQYEHQHGNCDDLCEIDHNRIDIKDPTKMPCATCPFCEQVVTAELTPSTISCPECKACVNL